MQLLKSAISHMFHSSDAKSDSPSYHICLLCFFFAASICLNISFFIFRDMSVSGEFYSASLQMFRVSCVNYRKSPWIHCLQFFCICHLEDHYSTAHQYYLRIVASHWKLAVFIKLTMFWRKGGMTLQAASTRRRIEPDGRRYALFIVITDMLIDELTRMLWL